MAESASVSAPLRRALWIGVVGLSLLIGFGVLVGLSASPGVDGKKAQARLGCTSLAVAIEAYVGHEANTKHEFPSTLRDLIQPPFGGLSFLRHDEADLLDPWGKPYEMERRRFKDGTEYVLVKTTAPDGLPISQFGFGRNAQPRD